ncbi:hypothetical protein BDW68DRAFT_174755 [Aspergillus falconensis]
MAYCPITQAIAYAFRDEAFENSTLTPNIIWRLKVPKRLQSLPLRWKPEKLYTLLLLRLERTPYGYELHESLSMVYDSSRQALQELGRDARFENDIGHYNYQRWTTNEVVDRVRPLVEIKKKLSQVRKATANHARDVARKEYFHCAPVLEVNKQIKQLLGQSDSRDSDAADAAEDEEGWELPILDYNFPERAQLIEHFYGPEAEEFDEEKLLALDCTLTALRAGTSGQANPMGYGR